MGKKTDQDQGEGNCQGEEDKLNGNSKKVSELVGLLFLTLYGLTYSMLGFTMYLFFIHIVDGSPCGC